MMSHLPTRRHVLKLGLGAALGGRALLSAQAAGATARPARAGAPSLPVAIQRCTCYEPRLVRARLDAALNLIGPLRGLVANKTVTIKINVTGGPGHLAGLPAYRTYHVHPHVLGALCAALHDAGARRIHVVESQSSRLHPEQVLTQCGWYVNEIKAAADGAVFFEDTRNRGAFADYARLTVPWGGLLYPAFLANRRYEQTDVFISLAKLKEHSRSGVSLSARNMLGMPPTSLYGPDAPDEDSVSSRLAIFGDSFRQLPAGVPAPVEEVRTGTGRMSGCARVIADCVGARPIDLAIIDGIETSRGGEGPWVKGARPVAPGLLVVGRNPVCTDAIATALMGHDPLAPGGRHPFPGENHLTMLESLGLGTADPARIEVRGLALQEAALCFARAEVRTSRS